MRILSISGRNLASLAGDFRVDLEHGPLARSGLFTITGPTGSGKSTLLDAMCLALYDTTPRTQADTERVKLSDVEGDLTTTDPRNLLRKGTGNGFAEVVFIGRDGRRYRSRWSVRRARDKATGRLQPQLLELECLDDQTLQAGTKTEVLAAIRKVVGLDFPQFRRAVLLAQGDFAAFLAAKSDERGALLERMSGTELYSEISKAAFRRHDDEKKALEALVQKVSSAPALGSEERAALETELQAAKTRLEEAKKDEVARQQATVWWKTSDELAARLEASKTALIEAELASRQAAPLVEELKQAESVQPLRAVFEAADRTAQEVQSAGKDAEAARAREAAAKAAAAKAATAYETAMRARQTAGAEFEALRPALEEARRVDVHVIQAAEVAQKTGETSDEAQKAKDEAQRALGAVDEEFEAATEVLQTLTQWLAEHASAVSLERDWERLRLDLERLAEATGELVQVQKDLATREETSKTLAAKVEAARVAHADEAAAATTAAQALEAATQLAAETPRAALEERRDALDAGYRRTEALVRVAEAGAEAEIQADRVKESETQISALEHSLSRTRALEKKALQQKELDAHRALLVDGQPCPLCGSTTHPGVDRTDKTAQIFQDELKALEQEIKTARLAAMAAQAALLNAQEAQAGAQREAAEWTKRLSDLRDDWAGKDERFDEGVLEALAVRLEADREALEEVKAALTEQTLREAEVTSARAVRDASQKTAQAAREALELVERGVQEATSKVTLAEAAVSSAEARMREAAQHVKPAFSQREGWEEALHDDPQAFITALQSEVETARLNKAQRDETQKRLQVLATRRAVLEAELKSAAQAATQAATRHMDALARLKTLKTQRTTLLEGQPAAGVESEWTTRVEELQQALETATKAHQTSEAALQKASGAVETQVAAVKTRQEAAQQAQTAVETALAEDGRDVEAVRRLLSFDDAWHAARRDAIRAAELSLVAAQKTHQERAKDSEEHEAKARPEGTHEEALEALKAAQAGVEAAAGAVREREVFLRQDDERKVALEAAQKDIDRQQQVVDLWAQLNGLIGSADGGKLRTFVQSLTLDLLLRYANRHLDDLARRYRLARVPTADLSLQVIDRDMGDEVRGVASLSGGETFLVSLALALGLSSLASERMQVDSLFIDEGFGSLDEGSLDTAIAALEALQGTGRQIGFISHVAGLADRIGAQVRVVPQGARRSVVEVVEG